MEFCHPCYLHTEPIDRDSGKWANLMENFSKYANRFGNCCLDAEENCL